MVCFRFVRHFRHFLRSSEKATDQSKILDFGSQNSLLQHNMCPNLFSKITRPTKNVVPTYQKCCAHLPKKFYHNQLFYLPNKNAYHSQLMCPPSKKDISQSAAVPTIEKSYIIVSCCAHHRKIIYHSQLLCPPSIGVKKRLKYRETVPLIVFFLTEPVAHDAGLTHPTGA